MLGCGDLEQNNRRILLFLFIPLHAICLNTQTHTQTHKQREGERERGSKNNHHLMSSSKFWVGSLSLQDWSWRGLLSMGGWEPSSGSLNKAEQGLFAGLSMNCAWEFCDKLRKSHFTHCQLYNKKEWDSVKTQHPARADHRSMQKQQHLLSSRNCLLGKI